MRQLAPILLGLVLAQPALSSSILVDDQAGATGLLWSSPANTVGLSFDEVVASGWYDAGWRHATFTEVCSLFAAYADYTLACPPGGLQDFGDQHGASFVILNGDDFGYPDWGYTHYKYEHCDWMNPDCYDFYTYETKVLDGLFDDGTPGDGVGRARVYQYYQSESIATRTYQTAYVAGNDTSSSFVGETQGHWLACPSGTCQAPAVPEPQLGTLLVGSLALVLAATSRRHGR